MPQKRYSKHHEDPHQDSTQNKHQGLQGHAWEPQGTDHQQSLPQVPAVQEGASARCWRHPHSCFEAPDFPQGIQPQVHLKKQDKH